MLIEAVDPLAGGTFIEHQIELGGKLYVMGSNTRNPVPSAVSPQYVDLLRAS